MVARAERSVVDMLQCAYRRAQEDGAEVYGYGLSREDYRRYREALWREVNWLGGDEMPPDLHTNPQKPDLAFRGGHVYESDAVDAGCVAVQTHPGHPESGPLGLKRMVWNMTDEPDCP